MSDSGFPAGPMQVLSRQVLPRQVSPAGAYASLRVAVDDGRHAAARVRLAADLAHRFGARLIGAAGCLPEYPQGSGRPSCRPHGDRGDPAGRPDRLAGAERVFRQTSCLNDRIEWRRISLRRSPSSSGNPAPPTSSWSGSGGGRGVSPGMAVSVGDVLMGPRSPGLVVRRGSSTSPPAGSSSAGRTRSRPAERSRMPCPSSARGSRPGVRVAETGDRAEIEDVAAYLALHDVPATTQVMAPAGWSVAETLEGAAEPSGPI